ncbi:MAG: class I SAM-dependent methyltransferase [Gammaproteobacteria bacterium]
MSIALKQIILESEEASLQQLEDFLPHKKSWLMMGDLSFFSTIAALHVGPPLILNNHLLKSGTNLVSRWDKLALADHSIDACFLPHILERCLNPHEVLRETYRILKPEGLLLLSHFNPYSLWGFYHLYQKLSKISRHVNFLSKNRIYDWLSLMDFEIIESRNFLWRPPLPSVFLQKNLKLLDYWHWLSFIPFMGGAYWILAQKRTIPLIPVKNNKRNWLLKRSPPEEIPLET